MIKIFFLFGLLSGLLFFACVSSPPALNKSQKLQAIREKNLQEELNAMNNFSAAAKNISQTADKPEINSPLTLTKAIELAIKYNLDAAIEKLKYDIQEETVVGTRLKMIPSLTVEGKLDDRDTYNASYSSPLYSEGGQDYNYSRDKEAKTYSMKLSWDLLEFGISYFQYRQAYNRLGILEQQRQRMLQNLRLDVTKTFWQVQVSKKAMGMALQMIERLQEREKILQNHLEAGMMSEIDALETSAALAEMKLMMSGFENELKNRKFLLASLIGMAGQTDFLIAQPDFSIQPKEIVFNIKDLQTLALRCRPELIEQDLEELISINEARSTMVSMAPKTSIYWSYNYDDDSHLYYDNWQNIGLSVSYNLLSIPKKISSKKETSLKKELVKKHRLSIAAAILTQLNITAIEYQDAIRKYRQTQEISLKQKQLMEARIRHADLGTGSIEDVLKSEARYLFAMVRSLNAYAEVIIAEKKIFNTVGQDEIKCIHYK